MVSSSEFLLGKVQAVLYTPDTDAFSQPKILAAMLGQFAGTFDGEVQAIPVPADFPREFPQIHLKSQDGSRELTAGPMRLDVFWNTSSGESLDGEKVMTQCQQLFEQYMRATGIRVSRLALITHRLCMDPMATQTAIVRFCRPDVIEEFFSETQIFELHQYRRVAQQRTGFFTNQWVRFKTAHGLGPGLQPGVGLVVEQDTNTVDDVEVRYLFDPIQMRLFFDEAMTEGASRFAAYFPEGV